ncbi:hypothetical protein JYS44_00420, partial [Phycisphaeraceae bacterium AH-315-B13]|nr:hypothetical protein [Phycisphaeraceae bacterium AH-315-B13]
MHDSRNILEDACYQLAVNFLRANDIMNAKYLIRDQSVGNELWELCYKNEQRAEFALNGLSKANRERSKRKSSKVQSDTSEAMSVAALVLWYTAVEEYCFSLLRVIAKTKPALLSDNG